MTLNFVTLSGDEETLAVLKAEAERLKAELARMERKLRVWENDAPEADIPTASMRLSPGVLRGEAGEALAVLAAQQRIDGGAFHRG
jgi:hypothetical protein